MSITAVLLWVEWGDLLCALSGGFPLWQGVREGVLLGHPTSQALSPCIQGVFILPTHKTLAITG